MVTKICDFAKCYNRHRSKNIWVTRLFFCQNGVFLGGLFWQKCSLVTLILFELCLLWYLAQSQILVISLCSMYINSLAAIDHLSINQYKIYSQRINNQHRTALTIQAVYEYEMISFIWLLRVWIQYKFLYGLLPNISLSIQHSELMLLSI